MKTCPNELCKHIVNDESEFCPACGEEMPHHLTSSVTNNTHQSIDQHNLNQSENTHVGILRPPPVYTPPPPPDVSHIVQEQISQTTQTQHRTANIKEAIKEAKPVLQNPLPEQLPKLDPLKIQPHTSGTKVTENKNEGSNSKLKKFVFIAGLAFAIFYYVADVLNGNSENTTKVQSTQTTSTTGQQQIIYHTAVYFNTSTGKYSLSSTSTTLEEAIQIASSECEKQGGNCIKYKAKDGKCVSVVPNAYIGAGNNYQEADEMAIFKCQKLEQSCKVAKHVCAK
jgi:hypothetical protein